MSVWEYSDQTRDALLTVMRSRGCVYCGDDLHKFQPVEQREPWGDRKEWRVRVCQTCGWWKIAKIDHLEEGNLYRAFRSAAAGSLRTLDVTDIETPVEEVRNFLLARYEARFDVSPYLFERTVASVFEDMGYRVLVTSRSGDDGIDVFLYGSTDEVIGVQVKRYRASIKVSQIRELLGALVVNRLTRGVFVTTSQFQSGAAKSAASQGAKQVGLSIELIDGATFYEALRITRRAQFTLEDVPTLIERANYTHVNLSGTQHLGIAPDFNAEILRRLPGPGGPQDEWP
jgi:restriction system protein